jgi:hypothetical protein
MFAAQAIDSGKDIVYHLAGRDMMQYMPAKAQRIEAIINLLQERSFLGQLHLVIVPTSGTKIIAKKSDADILREMWYLTSQRDSGSKRQLRRLLQERAVKSAMKTEVSIKDSEVFGGEGIVVINEAVQTPIAHIKYRLR